MKNFNYNVNTYFADDSEMTFRTNNVRDAIEAFFENVENGVHCDIVNGFTGEVLALCGHPEGEDFANDEMALMMLGYLCAEHWGEGEDEEVPTCQSCGGEIDEQGVCEYCGVVDGSADGVAVPSIAEMINELANSCSAIKCKIVGLPS